MNVIVVSNCVTSGYHLAVSSLFPDWNVKAAGINEAERWLRTGEKPEFSLFLADCDLFIGWPIRGHIISTVLNPSADRIILPELYFRGLHPDVAQLNNFWGPFSIDAPHTQTSLLMLGARSIGMTAKQTESLFCEAVYDRLGFFDLYKAERRRIVTQFFDAGVQLDEAFDWWEKQGDFFYICHHPRSFVLVDIIRFALKGRYLSEDAFANSESLRWSQRDTLAWTEVWPVYPEIARRTGFNGSLTWLKNSQCSPREMSLSQVIDNTFKNLERMDAAWKSVPFVAECARRLQM
ncbi:MAG TPA: WcbI family polysaccharide biosynthesis putative acetyltransferase [Lacipirellulaceae bacterium]|nr:WcbI family polysaccharide biosynthesis putative acetyltransferase [Lacipirellulaceae bacterium]